MAQIDTGMGWSAKGEYLIQSDNVNLGTIGGFSWDIPGFDSQHLPVTGTSAAEVYSNGLNTITFWNPSHDRQYSMYVGADIDGVIVGMEYSGTAQKTIFFSTTPAVVKCCQYNNTDQIVSRFWTVEVNNGSLAYPGVYYGYDQGSGAGDYEYNGVYNIPIFTPWESSLQSFLANAYPHINFAGVDIFKLNPGFAVACVAKWYSPSGDLLMSPVLISSDVLATAMTTDGTTPASAMSTFDFLRDGMRFYMSIIGGNTQGVQTLLISNDLTQFGAALPSKVFSLLAEESYANIIVTDAPDPYGENTEEDGGDGTDPDDDPVEEETLPLPAVVGLGFSTIYVPTQADLYNLAAYMWGGNLDLDNFLKLFANPMDSILGLSAVPLALSGTYEPIYLGGQQLQGITMPKYTGRTSVKVDMGTVTIKERWGAYLDYDPYTEFAIYVPFIGIKNIKADDVMEKTVRLMYNIDILSGACVAYLRVEGGSVLYEWSGQCAVQIPITGANWDNIFSTAVSTAATLGGALFAPASAPVLGGAVASAAVQAVAAKPRIERSGAMNGITGFLGQLRPYILRTTPEAYIPGDQNKFIGYPSYMSVSLGSLSGYNEIASIHLENIPATADELAELESILKGGAIF